jgi:GrpB-like predicted nucleotidyltransferase (UPF0157 family)
VAVDGSHWRNHLKFRDVLSADGALHVRYGELKRPLQEQFAQDHGAYTRVNDDFIRGVLSTSQPAAGAAWTGRCAAALDFCIR